MAKVEITVIKCDRCGFESTDPTEFLHVQVSPIQTSKGRFIYGKPITSRELCIESCVGAPAVNRDR